ncbi:ABC transporter permease subunit [Nonomuraea sp. NPDC004580]|uniref:ABC transporter permease n=1 Tax=Nonomuraea sp. NPDC004580 TaxID=3154552 RepID=UPI0033A3F586
MSTAENGGPAGTSTLGGRARRTPGLVPVTETLRTTDRTTPGPDGAVGLDGVVGPTGATGAWAGATASNAAPAGATVGGEDWVAERGAGRATAATGAAGAGRAIGAFWRLLGSELGLTFRRPRNLVILAVLAVVPVVIGVTLRVVGGGDEGMGGIVQDVAGNSLMLTFLSFSFLTLLLMPVAVSVVAGDAIAGEAGAGTLRYLLAAPAGRTRLLMVKFLNAAVYSYAVTAVVALSALVTGLLLFPAGPVTLLSGTTISMAEGLLRIAICVGYVGAGMAALAAVALALSVFTEVSIGAIAGTMVLIIVCQVLRAIPELDAVAPYLLPTRFTDFDAVLRSPIDVAALRDGLLAFGAYILLFGSIAWARFSGKDITS